MQHQSIEEYQSTNQSIRLKPEILVLLTGIFCIGLIGMQFINNLQAISSIPIDPRGCYNIRCASKTTSPNESQMLVKAVELINKSKWSNTKLARISHKKTPAIQSNL